ncbi:MAG: AAA family ATPase [Gammaproteobacteria bacterium]|nr:AAA family ATPase [Gammaproteobacteria bacterium]
MSTAQSPRSSDLDLRQAADIVRGSLLQLDQVILGKPMQTRLSLACLLAGGHLLIEDLPGVGKTTLAHALAKALGLNYQRIQFTSDLLPADITGVSIFDAEAGKFHFHPGPVFSQLVLADEVNRATPKTQSALLEAMEENQVTAEGETLPLPTPFFVVATQNPAYQVGTFPLPESQLDRFLMRIELGYPDAAAERDLLRMGDRREEIKKIQPLVTPTTILELQQLAQRVHVSDALLDYVQAIVRFTRSSPDFESGLSPRAALALLRAARAWALMAGHSGVTPDDLQAIAPGVISHRLRRRDGQAGSPLDLASAVLDAVPIP